MKPKHIAIILDGNRRFAKKQGLEPWKGHDFGAKNVENLLEWCRELGIKELTLYTFSTENFNRSRLEVEKLMQLFEKFFTKVKQDKRVMEKGMNMRFVGNLSLFPENVQKAMQAVMEMTKNNKEFIVNFAMGYGGRAEIVNAVKIIAEKAASGKIAFKDIDERLVLNELWLHNEPDMVIRPGGELRLSNFLPYQSTYSELYFLEKLWPEITKEDIEKAMEEFETRERRIGR
ncbi:MAG TPA: di-trans,poly-cis-decaprenylcistransferase [Nanoarchaeota archaeon]|nr:di-trans,poly-cis-decaprenylcistransferase [Nanoarchaeota archaeon]